MRVSIILPVYNSRKDLKNNFNKVYSVAKRLGSFELILAVDGSRDGSAELAAELGRRSGVRPLIVKQRLGRGRALKNAISAAKGDVIGYLDIDMSTSPNYIPEAVKKIESGYKVVSGSRYSKESESSRTAKRLTESLGYNMLVKVFLGSRISDHQCGFKFWDAKYIKKEIPLIKDNHWFFDTEMLVRAQRNGVKIYELPVKWKESKETTVRFSDIFYFLGQINRMRSES